MRVSAKAGERFLASLASAPLARKQRYSSVDTTDHYPHVEVALHFGATDLTQVGGFIILASESQADDMCPWRVVFGGKTWWSEFPEIHKALRGLDRPLHVACSRR